MWAVEGVAYQVVFEKITSGALASALAPSKLVYDTPLMTRRDSSLAMAPSSEWSALISSSPIASLPTPPSEPSACASICRSSQLIGGSPSAREPLGGPAFFEK